MPNDDIEDEEDTTTTDDKGATDSEMDEGGADQGDGDLSIEDLTAQLAQVRAQLKSVNDESAGRRVQLKKLEDEKRERELSEMDATERLQAELADLKQQLADSAMQSDELTTLNETIQTQVDTLLKELNVPKHIQELIEPMTPAKQLDYLNKNRKAFTGKKRQPNIDSSGKSGGSGTSSKERKKKMQEKKRVSKRYSL